MADKKISAMTAPTLLRSDAKVPFIEPSVNDNYIVDMSTLLFRDHIRVICPAGSDNLSTTSYNVIAKISWAITNFGTQTQPTPAPATSLFDSLGRYRYTSSAATNAGAGIVDAASGSTSGNTGVYRSISGSALGGGFTLFARFAHPTIRSDQRIFTGYEAAQQTSWGNQDPSARVNCFGLGLDQADANLQIMHNDGSGTATKVDTGITRANAAGKVIELTLHVEPNGSTMYYRVVIVDSGTAFAGSVSSNLPAADTLLYLTSAANTGTATSTAVAIDIIRFVQRTKY